MAEVIKIATTVTAIATALKIPPYPAQEVIRKLFLQSKPVPLPEDFEYITETGITDYHLLTEEKLTVKVRHNADSNIKDVASLLAYIKLAVKSVMDISAWENYTGPAAPAATGEPWEPKWVPHYPPPGKYAVYPPSAPAGGE